MFACCRADKNKSKQRNVGQRQPCSKHIFFVNQTRGAAAEPPVCTLDVGCAHVCILLQQHLLPWLVELVKASGCLQYCEGGCTSLLKEGDGARWLEKDGLVDALKGDPTLSSLIYALAGRGKTTSQGDGHTLQYFLYIASVRALEGATPAVIARGGSGINNFKFDGACAAEGKRGYFWNDYLTTVIPHLDFKKCSGRMMLFHAEVRRPAPLRPTVAASAPTHPQRVLPRSLLGSPQWRQTRPSAKRCCSCSPASAVRASWTRSRPCRTAPGFSPCSIA